MNYESINALLVCVKLRRVNESERLQVTVLVYLISRSDGDKDCNLCRFKKQHPCLA